MSFWRSIGVPEDELPDDEDHTDSIVDPEGVRPRIWFLKVPEAKVVKNRVHLDLKVAGGRTVPSTTRRAGSRRGRADDGAGATRLRRRSGGRRPYHVVMTDPEGNEFCVA